jgi:hypothetical protein
MSVDCSLSSVVLCMFKSEVDCVERIGTSHKGLNCGSELSGGKTLKPTSTCNRLYTLLDSCLVANFLQGLLPTDLH